MKIRQGFVSNSSSSSFVIAVPKGMELTEQSLHEQLWGTTTPLTFGPEYPGTTTSIDSYDAVRDIIRQIESGRQYEYDNPKGKVDDELSEVIQADYDWDLMEKYRMADGTYNWEEYNAKVEAMNKVAVEQFRTKYNNHDFYVVEYEDHSMFGCEMEHGDAMRTAKDVTRVSHH